MNAQQATNIVQLLRTDPASYRNFGPYWWWVKRQLKANGHTAKVLPHLGSFEDPDPYIEELYAGREPEELDRISFETAAEAAQYHPNDPESVDDETGDTYRLYDEDAGF